MSVVLSVARVTAGFALSDSLAYSFPDIDDSSEHSWGRLAHNEAPVAI